MTAMAACWTQPSQSSFGISMFGRRSGPPHIHAPQAGFRCWHDILGCSQCQKPQGQPPLLQDTTLACMSLATSQCQASDLDQLQQLYNMYSRSGPDAPAALRTGIYFAIRPSQTTVTSCLSHSKGSGAGTISFLVVDTSCFDLCVWKGLWKSEPSHNRVQSAEAAVFANLVSRLPV